MDLIMRSKVSSHSKSNEGQQGSGKKGENSVKASMVFGSGKGHKTQVRTGPDDYIVNNCRTVHIII